MTRRQLEVLKRMAQGECLWAPPPLSGGGPRFRSLPWGFIRWPTVIALQDDGLIEEDAAPRGLSRDVEWRLTTRGRQIATVFIHHGAAAAMRCQPETWKKRLLQREETKKAKKGEGT